MGGETIQQCLRDGLIDALHLQIAPVVLGGGLRMFDDVGHFELTPTAAMISPQVTHLRYQIVH